MKTHHKRLAGTALLALGLIATPMLAQTAAGSTSDQTRRTSGSPSVNDPALTPSAQGPGSTIGQTSPASPTDPAGRSIDRGSGENPNRINRAQPQARTDSRLRSDATGDAADGFAGQHSQKKASDVTGKSIRGTAGDDLGEISDLVIDAQSGQIKYAIVSSGGVLGIGGTRRAVPFSALNRASDGDEMMINLEKARWDNAPKFRHEDLATLNQETRAREIHQYFGQDWEESRVSTSQATRATDAARSSANLFLASDLDGKDIRAGDQKIGEVEDVLINAERRTASLLVELEDDFVDTDENFVIGFDQLAVSGSGRDVTITTPLSAADFQATTGASMSASLEAGRPYVWSEGAVGQKTRVTRPTAAAEAHPNSGREAAQSDANYATSGVVRPTPAESEEPVRFADSTANPQNRPTVSARENTSPSTATSTTEPAQRHAAAVREALRNDATLRTAAENVDVSVRGDSLVLSGNVASQDERQRVLEAARRAASGQRIDDQLRVRGAAE